MRVKTKETLLQAATAAAFICAAAVIFLPGVAAAAPAVASATVNVRSGPSTSSAVIGSLHSGQTVDVQGCRNGWCYINGPTGFVSSAYLRSGGVVVQPNFNLSFNFPQGGVSIGTGGVSIGLGTPSKGPGGPGPGHGPGPNPGGSGNGDVCFYSGAGYTGQAMCMNSGDRTPYVGDAWNNKISSIRNTHGLSVEVCDDAGNDDCRTYTTSAAYLGNFDNQISSIHVR